MTRRTLLILGCVLLSGPLVVAQENRAPADPVTGKWGEDGRTMLELKFDGKSTVSGWAIWHHPDSESQRTAIKAGTFDRKTGSLRLEGDGPRRPDGPAASYLIEGTIVDDVVTGTYKVGTDSGQFTFKKQ